MTTLILQRLQRSLPTVRICYQPVKQLPSPVYQLFAQRQKRRASLFATPAGTVRQGIGENGQSRKSAGYDMDTSIIGPKNDQYLAMCRH